jgi:3-deoxy-7-phosphoheptulonate synthase
MSKPDEFRILGRRPGNEASIRFTYRGVDFDQDCFHVVAGLNAVDTREYVEQTFRALQAAGQVCARMGAYKPRTSPYSFQGYGKQCLPYVFELAGKYGIRVISMEVTRDEHLDEIREALRGSGDPTGVMLQIGTRNTQNFELLKAVGSQRDFPILLKRGFGITLHESLLAAEYVASAGNRDIVFCLRGMKTNFGDPHRNLIDFAQVPVVKRLTRMPVCVDPSHSVGVRESSPDGMPDIFHAAAQGIVAGANLVLTDMHPEPRKALVDAAQALTLAELPWFLEDCAIAREAYVARRAAAAARA